MDREKLNRLFELGRKLARNRGKALKAGRGDPAELEKLARAFERGRKLAQARNKALSEPAYRPPQWEEDKAPGPEGGVTPRAWRGIGWR